MKVAKREEKIIKSRILGSDMRSAKNNVEALVVVTNNNAKANVRSSSDNRETKSENAAKVAEGEEKTIHKSRILDRDMSNAKSNAEDLVAGTNNNARASVQRSSSDNRENKSKNAAKVEKGEELITHKWWTLNNSTSNAKNNAEGTIIVARKSKNGARRVVQRSTKSKDMNKENNIMIILLLQTIT